MGKKVNPNSFRLVVTKQWKSQWMARNWREEAKWIKQDDQIRKYLKEKLKTAKISHIGIIRRDEKIITVIIHCVEVGLVMGQDREGLKSIEEKIKSLTNYSIVKIEVVWVENPELNAQIVAYTIARAIENREPYKRAQKLAISKAMSRGAKGIKTKVSGRLNGADMSRSEGYLEGLVPSQTLTEHVEYGYHTAVTPYGLIGVKVWICYNPNKIIKRRRRELRRERQ